MTNPVETAAMRWVAAHSCRDEPGEAAAEAAGALVADWCLEPMPWSQRSSATWRRAAWWV